MLTIPLQALAQTAYEKFLADGLDRYSRGLGVGYFEEIVTACLEDELNFRMRWAKKSNGLDTLLEQLDADDWWKQKLELIIDRCIVCPVDDLLNKVMPSPTWQVWGTHWQGGKMTIEKRGDYRIMEWERLTEEYEPHRYPSLQDSPSPARLIIIPARMIARWGWSYWFKNKNESEDENLVTINQFDEITQWIIEDQLATRMIWANSSSCMENFLLESGLYDDYLSSIAFFYAVEKIGFRIEACLKNLISDHTWEIWQIKRLNPHGVVKLIRGKDYRIWDYPRIRQREADGHKRNKNSSDFGYPHEADSVPY